MMNDLLPEVYNVSGFAVLTGQAGSSITINSVIRVIPSVTKAV
jgi:hypothetical protein